MASEATGYQENEDRDGGSIGNEQGTVSSRELSSMRNSRSGYISWLTRVYNEAERLLLSPICTEDEVLAKRDLIFTAFSRFEEVHFSLLTLLEEDYEGRKGLEDSFAYQLERRTTFLAKVDNWIVNQSVDPKDSASQAGLSVSTKTSCSSTGSSKLKLREARERRELARLKMQQLQLSQDLEQKRVDLKKQEERLKLRHEYELASASERIWTEPEAALELKPVGRGLDERFLQPCYSEVPKDESVPRPVCQHVPYERNPGLTESVSKVRVTPNKSFLNPLAPEWESKPMIPFPTSLSDDCGTKSGTDRSDLSNLVQSLTSALTLGFSMPRPEILTFDGSPLEYWKFIRSFEVNVADITDDPRRKLTYLIQYCSGEAKEVIENCCVLEPKEGYERAREILHHQFGRPHIVARAHINQLAKGQSIKPTDSAALQSLSRQMLKCELTLSQMGFDADLNNSETLLGIMDRLPPYLQRKWTERAETIFRVGKRPCFSDLTAFVQQSADTANNMFGLHLNEVPRRGTNFTVRGDELQGNEFWSSSPREDPGGPTRESTRGRANESTRRSSRESLWDFSREGPRGNTREITRSERLEDTRTCFDPPLGPQASCFKCPLCSCSHTLSNCKTFKGKTYQGRLDVTFQKRVCRNCLLPGHYAKGCAARGACDRPGCQKKHHSLLHPPVEMGERREGEGSLIASQGSVNVLKGGERPSEKRVCLRVVPVRVQGCGNSRIAETYALLDDGSDVSLCDLQLLEQLGLSGVQRQFTLSTLNKEDHGQSGREVSLQVTSLDATGSISLPRVWSVDKIPVSEESFPVPDDVKRWSHLSDIDLPHIDGRKVMLLIGGDCPDAFWVLDERRGTGSEPYAVKFPLGWTLLGPVGPARQTGRAHVNLVHSKDDLLQLQVERFWRSDFSDCLAESRVSMSVEDKQALEIMKETVTLVKGHYQIGLPWKRRPPLISNNRSLAESRLDQLKRRLLKNEDLRVKYSTTMNEYLSNGHAAKLTSAELLPTEGKFVWYLPHHPVFHPRKPGKVRVVFDCAAKFLGVSLNDMLLQGPDLNNNLIGVLMRFREEPVAVVADIESMFHQVRVDPEDCDALRFLWWPSGDLSQSPEEYKMVVHVFGATSSPSCTGFCLLKTAEDNQNEFPAGIVRIVRRNFYVDDCLKSLKTPQEAKTVVKELAELLSRGGFRLTKWISNDREVLESIPQSERAASVVDLALDEIPVERTLGIQWNVGADKFCFKVVAKEKPLTRRGVLSVASSLYDPLGFVAPFTLSAKMILQELCKKRLGWDERIDGEELKRWKDWLADLPRLSEIAVSRCFKPLGFGDVLRVQLHHFSDASQGAYGTASYLRLVDVHGNIHCSFIIGKSRLAPLRSITIPRLELSAAVMSVKIDHTLRRELDLPLVEGIFWCDSTSVIQLIRNTSKRFHTFVANRLSVIHDGSSPEQWRYVDSKSNPADDVSRGLTAECLIESKRWLNGPDFLWKTEECWPERIVVADLSNEHPDVKPEGRVLMASHQNALYPFIDHYSSWDRLKRGVAWLLRFKGYLSSKLHGEQGVNQRIVKGELSVEEILAAERAVLAAVQQETFKDHFTRSSSSRSPLHKLCPVLVDGTLRVGGRLGNAHISEEAKRPIILPKKHHVTDIIIRKYHEELAHAGREHVLASIRQKFWIVKGRVAVRRVLRNCFSCRRRNASAGEQRMADLPSERLIPDQPPFTFVGVDYFGPVLVKQKRSHVKRYGCIFTCLTTRAIHIEIAHSLDTDSFISAMRRFIARRGRPQVVRSDNGTNFHAGERELRAALDGWNQQWIDKYASQQEIKWIFNPPAAAHMGGVWERLVRSVKKILTVLLSEQVVGDESLLTVVAEAESILNSRPLTQNPDDPTDAEPLTPNHLLMLKSNQSMPPGSFSKQDQYSRRRWRQVQYLADVFWRRWLREYLPTLQKRHKWFSVCRDLKEDDLVLIVDENVPRGQWRLGRVVLVHKAKDGHVRSAVIKTRSGHLTRPISKLCFLENFSLSA